MSVAQALTIGTAVVQVKQQNAIGKFNQRVAERNAAILEYEAEQINKQAEFDIARFDQQFRKEEGAVEVALAKSGVVIDSGSGARITEANNLEKEMQNKITRYNADVGIAQKMEEANFSRIQGQMAKNAARLANISTISKVGTSLLATTNFGEKKITDYFPKRDKGELVGNV
jgi:phenylalanyl-tRNA synthetase alpha subunit